MNLYDVMMGSQGGQGVDTLAHQFGISPQQTQAALQAMVPAFALGFQKASADPMGFGALISQMANTAHGQTYSNPAQAFAAAPALGDNVVGQIFGPQIAAQVGQQAAQASGVSAQVIQQMMPIVASMLIGGVANAMAAQGLGNLVGQLSQIFAANAGLAPKPAPAPNPAADAGAMMTNWMNMMGAMIPKAAASGAEVPQLPAMQAGLAALNGLMQAGVQISQAQQQGMAQILEQIGKSAKS